MKIQCLGLRDGGTKVDIDGLEYHFEPLEDGKHVAVVEDEAHIDRFLSISDHYKVYHGELTPKGTPARIAPAGKPRVFVAPQKTAEVLYGSNVHETSYEIGGKTYSIGDIVALAHKTSELTVEEWNELDEGDRHAKIDIALDDLADAAEKAAAQKPEEPAGDQKPEAPKASDAPASDERAALVEQYVAKFGKKPHYNASVETIKAKLAE